MAELVTDNVAVSREWVDDAQRRLAEKDAQIKALADALGAAKVAMWRGEFGDKGRDRHVPSQVDAALRAVGRLP